MLNHLNKKIAVVKLGGNVLSEKQALVDLAQQVIGAQKGGFSVVLVHGGGSQIDTALAASGIKPTKINGLRITDAATMNVVQQVLDSINSTLSKELLNLGITAAPFDSSSHLLKASPAVLENSDGTSVSLGQVGTIELINCHKLYEVLNHVPAAVPLIAPIAVSSCGNGMLFNINADEVAGAIAITLSADLLVFATDVSGVLTDAHSGQAVPVIYANQLQPLIDAGIITGGMIPKMKTAIGASAAGVGSVLITNGTAPNFLIQAIDKPGVGGTLIALPA